MNSFLKQNFKKGTYFIGSFLAYFLIGLYIYHEWNLRQPPHWTLSDSPEKNLYPNAFLLKIGRFPVWSETKKLLFFNFPKEKSEGVIRIGTFGDSYTYGREVSDGNDYPSYLNRLFKNKITSSHTHRAVEVLNFGKGGIGFQQTFMMWEQYAETYDLDYILLGPSGFGLFHRDVSFATNFWQRIQTEWPPKARYILQSDDKLREIHIKGHTLQERHKRYYKLIPSWNHIRYDRHPFQALDDYFPFLQYLSSPLYYTTLSAPKEATKINTILLKKIASKHPKRVLFLVAWDTVTDPESSKQYALYNSIDFVDINKIQIPKLFLYKRRGHYSNLGYEIWAKQFFYALTGKSSFSIQNLSCNKKSNVIFKMKSPDFKFPLGKVTHISLQLLSDNFNMGELIVNTNDYDRKKELAFKIPKHTQAFIFFHSQNFIHSPVIFPVPFSLKKGDKVFVGPSESDNRLLLGEINPLDERHIFFEFPLENRKNQNVINIYDAKDTTELTVTTKAYKKHSFIYINDQMFGRLIPSSFHAGKIQVKPLLTNHGFLLIGPDQHYSHRDLPTRLSFSFLFQMNDGKKVVSAIPSWECKKQSKAFNLRLLQLNFIKL